MSFAALVAFIFVLGLRGRRATKGTYALVAAAAVAVSAWEYLT
jgi:hypothetical protein